MAYILIFISFFALNWSTVTIQAPKVKADSSNLSAITIQNVITLTNESREKNGLHPLKENAYLDRFASFRINNDIAHDNFSHIDSYGKHSYQEVDTSIYPYKDFGENLSVLFTNAIDEQNAWDSSPEHEDNILNPKFQDIGVAIQQGNYQGYPTIWVAVEFGDE